VIPHRVRQFRHANGVPTDDDFALGRAWLAPALYELFAAQHPRDIVHSANTARWLLDRGHDDSDLIAAAFLHDIGKGHQRRVDRVVYVLAGHAGVARRVAAPSSRWEVRRAVGRSLSHSQTGAERLRQAAAPARVVELTERHHDAAVADPVLALLQQADAAS
jgi:putative nucleotidyltransferase with HDIG domain